MNVVWAHKTSVTPPLFIEVSMLSHDSERSCIYVGDIDFTSVSKISLFD